MTGRQDFHTSILNFATKVTTAIDSRRGCGSGRSRQVTATIAFAEGGRDGDSRKFTISYTTGQTMQLKRVPVWDNPTISVVSGGDDECPNAGGRSPPV